MQIQMDYGPGMLMTVEEPQSAQSPLILLVDDEEGLREVLCAFLETWSYRVILAENGPNALKFAEEFHGPIDMLITDFRMPKMDGIELAQKLRVNRPKMKVLYMSGDPMAMASSSRLEAGAHVVAKPFSRETLGARVRALLACQESDADSDFRRG